MTGKNKKIAILEEMERGDKALEAARILVDKEIFEDATSRAYYAAFHGAQAVLLTEGHQPKSHQGTIYLFVHHFVKKGLIEAEYSQILARAAKYREEADYRHTMVFTKEQVDLTIKEVGSFLKRVRDFLRAAGY